MYTYKINKQASILLTIILLIWLAHLSSNLIWQLVTTNTYTISQIPNITIKEKINTLNLPNNLFGIVKQAPKTYKKTKHTRLNLNLIGILNQGKRSLAIIKYNSKDNIYQIGDTISSGITLQDVKKKYIILNRHGNLEKLQLKQKKLNKSVITTNKETANLSQKQKATFKKYQRQLLSNPVGFFSLVGIQPKYINDELYGFTIFPTKEKKLFSDLGFKKDDIITKINQNSFKNINQAMRLGRELAQQQSFEVTIQRKQETKTISINL